MIGDEFYRQMLTCPDRKLADKLKENMERKGMKVKIEFIGGMHNLMVRV
jgi:hypothetical protein